MNITFLIHELNGRDIEGSLFKKNKYNLSGLKPYRIAYKMDGVEYAAIVPGRSIKGVRRIATEKSKHLQDKKWNHDNFYKELNEWLLS